MGFLKISCFLTPIMASNLLLTLDNQDGIYAQNESLDERFAKQRSDFFDRIDPILKEVTASRTEREIV
jgi:hypothetical protein